MLAIEINSISKEFKGKKNLSIKALDNLSLRVEKGEIFGLLGPNGAGKTTLIKILLGIVFADSGSAKILGEDISNFEFKKKIGYLPENHKFPNFLTGEQVLKFFGELGGIKDKQLLESKVNEYIKIIGLEKYRKLKISKYSKGMMQRIGIGHALINDPEVIFLDEPTDGVDPIGRKDIRDLLLELKGLGKTIFLNSHLLSEVEQICDRVAILNNGILIKEGKLSELTKVENEYQIALSDQNSEEKLKIVQAFVPEYKLNEKTIILKLENQEKLNELIDKLRQNGILIESMNLQKKSLEDLFINLVKESNLGGK